MDIAVGILHGKGRAAKGGRLDADGQQRQRFLHDGVDHALIVGDAAGDDIVQAVIIFDIHAVQVVAVLIGAYLADGSQGFETAQVQPAESENAHKNQNQQGGQDALDPFFHTLQLLWLFAFNRIIEGQCDNLSSSFIITQI